MNNRIPKCGVLTTFTGSSEAYSLVNVVRTQLEMLMSAGYHPVLFVSPSFSGDGIWSGRVVEIRRVAEPDAKADEVKSALLPLLTDIDVMLCHDILFLGQHIEWAKAVRSISLEKKNIAWLHWQHSRGGHAPIEPVENSWFCYPNRGDLQHVAEINSTTLEKVRYIPHPLDLKYLEWPSLAIDIAEQTQFPFVDIRMIYPSRLDRQKQLEKLVRLFAGLKKAGKTVRLLIADAYATGEHFMQYKKELRQIAVEIGLDEEEFIFLSEISDDCTFATPRKTVKALLEMSNIFIQSSNAETCSLVVTEAILAGNIVVINADFPPIHHLYKAAITLPFGSVFEDVKYYREVKTAGGVEQIEDDQLFWDDRAIDTIIPILNSSLTTKLRDQLLKERWPNFVFAEHLEPLILEVFEECRVTEQAKVKVVESETHGDPDVTAIVTTLDNLPVLQKQIPILKQECGHIIVVNNGSRDGTRAWLDGISDRQIRTIHRGNMGAGPGRNAGLDLWDNSTPFTLMLDGGIMPPVQGVQSLKNYLLRHDDVSVISPEVATSYTDDEKEITNIFPEIKDEWTFAQSDLSGTAYALCKAKAWDGLRFAEDGPFGMPGWGVDDNDMMYRWNDAGIFHHDIAAKRSGLKLLRRASGSFQRLYKETGIWPNQYGSVYEMRNVLIFQRWRQYYDFLYHKWGDIKYSFVIDELQHPELAEVIKKIHDRLIEEKTSHEVIYIGKPNEETQWWLDTFALRWPWGNVTIDAKTGDIIRKDDSNESYWTGDVMINTSPRGKQVLRVNDTLP